MAGLKQRVSDLVYKVGDKVGDSFLSPPHSSFGQYVNRGPDDRRVVALTFDDGPSYGSTDRLLDVLAEVDAVASFFCVGENVRANPELLRRAYDEGHLIGNHSIDHSRGAGLSLRDTQHIERGEDEIADVLGVRPTMYRPPWGWLTPWEARRLHSRGYTIVGWDVYTHDWQLPAPSTASIVDEVLEQTGPGSIICLHDAYPLKPAYEKTVTADVVRDVVPRLRDDGYEFVTVADLLGLPATRPLDDLAA